VRAEQLEAAGRGRIIRGGLEHPRQRYVGPLDQRGRPDELGSVGFHARQYRSPGAAGRFVERLTTDRVQVIGYGQLVEGYQNIQAVVEGTLAIKQWRVLFTGDRDVAIEAWGWISSGHHVSQDGEPDALIFDRIERLEIRWGAGIGD
jgi:hypothetical protein